MHEAVIIGEQIAGESAKVRKELEGLVKNLNLSTLDVAELLHKVKSKKFYIQYGCNTFREYIQTLDLKISKAHYLARIAEVMEGCKIPRPEYEQIGLSKLRELSTLDHNSTYINPKTGEIKPMKEIIPLLVESGKTVSLEAIKEQVRTLKGLTDENELVWLNLCVKAEVRDKVVKPAFDLAKLNIGTVGKDDDGEAIDASDGRALEMICADFLSDPSNQPLEPVLEV